MRHKVVLTAGQSHGQSTACEASANTFHRQALGLLLALIRSHAKGSQGAAQGLPAINKLSASASRLLSHAPLADVLNFAQEAVDPFGQGLHEGVAGVLWESLVGALSRAVTSQHVVYQSSGLTTLAHLCGAVAQQVIKQSWFL